MSAADRAKWDARWAEREGPGDPSPSLLELAALLPTAGRALDVAGGAGRNAIWLARRGLDVTLVDVSPRALALAAAAEPRLATVELDLETAPPPPGPWDLILVSHFLDRALYHALPALLAPGGVWVLTHPTRENLLRHASPGAPFLLEPGEARTFMSGLVLMHDEEGWSEGGHHEARLVGRRPR